MDRPGDAHEVIEMITFPEFIVRIVSWAGQRLEKGLALNEHRLIAHARNAWRQENRDRLRSAEKDLHTNR